jgi:U6 snRNA-associated Sm-like protein LSm1
MAEGLSAAASLVEELDKRLLVVLRDGRHYIGILRSFDQFSNIVLEQTVERVVVDQEYADVPLGLYVVRGENVVLLGELAGAEAAAPPLDGHSRVSVAAIRLAQQGEREAAALKGSMKNRFAFLDLE